MSSLPQKLSDIQLRMPSLDRFVRPASEPALRIPISGLDGAIGPQSEASRPSNQPAVAEAPLPLFWYDPPWHQADVARRRLIAQFVGEFGVTVNVLHRELQVGNEVWDELNVPRMATHRCDRLGWTPEDSQSASIVELRLGIKHDEQLGFHYPSQRLALWLDHDADQPVAPLPPEPLLFPPEWNDLGQMAAKVTQLKRLGCDTVYVSIDQQHLEATLPAIAAARADGVIVRYNDCPLEALMRYRAWTRDNPTAAWRPRLWLAGDQLSAIDAVKCFALGASAVSVDAICQRWLLGDNGPDLTMAERAAMNLGQHIGPTPSQRLEADVQRKLGEFCTSIAAHAQSVGVRLLDELSCEHLIGP
jgi:hypothetical protein